MPEVLPIRREMFPELRDGLLRELNPSMPADRWKWAFEASHSEEPCGYALAERGSLVGLLGMIFSRRQIGGREERICNLHSWYVRPEYRTHSLELLRPLKAMGDFTMTDLSATSEVRAICRRLGFIELDRTAAALPPLGRALPDRSCELLDLDGADSLAANLLDQAERQIQRDHSRLDCRQVVVRDSGGYCYVVYSRITHGVLPSMLATTLVHHVSDPPRFALHHAAIRAHLMQRTHSQCVVVDSRLLAGERIAGSVCLPAIPKIYRSQRLRPEQIDGLYSEQVCLKLSTLPRWRSFLAGVARIAVPQFGERTAPAES